MVNIPAEFLHNRSEQLRKRVCNWTFWKAFNVFHIWKVSIWLSRKALYDLESETDLYVGNELPEVLTGLFTQKPHESESCTRLYIAEYMVRYPFDQPNVVSSSKPP